MRLLTTICALGALLAASSARAQSFDAAKAAEGEQVYETHCAACHGEKLRNNGQTFDIRKLGANERERYEKAVRAGKGQMPPWEGVLSDEEIDQIWHYIRSRAGDI